MQAAALGGWLAFVSSRQATRILMCKAVNQLSNVRMRLVLCHWQAAAQLLMQRKLHLRKVHVHMAKVCSKSRVTRITVGGPNCMLKVQGAAVNRKYSPNPE